MFVGKVNVAGCYSFKNNVAQHVSNSFSGQIGTMEWNDWWSRDVTCLHLLGILDVSVIMN